MAINILYLEDNHLYAEDVFKELAKYGSVELAGSELKFREEIDRSSSFGLAVLEQRVKWTSPSRNMIRPPQEVIEGGSGNAGIRCYDYLRHAPVKVVATPVVFYCLDSQDVYETLKRRGIKDNVFDFQCVEKDISFNRLHRAIRRIL